MGITSQLTHFPPRARRLDRRLAARDGRRVRDDRQRRRAHPATAITKVVFPDGSVTNLGDLAAHAGVHRRRGIRGHAGAEDGDPERHRHRRGLRLPGRRQDRHDEQLHRRLVRRLHPAARRPRSGSATRTRRRRCTTSTASAPGSAARSRRRSGTTTCRRRATAICGDFPTPTNPFTAPPSSASTRRPATTRRPPREPAPRARARQHDKHGEHVGQRPAATATTDAHDHDRLARDDAYAGRQRQRRQRHRTGTEPSPGGRRRRHCAARPEPRC